MKYITLLFGMIVAWSAFSADIIDVYGTNKIDAERVISKYSKQIAALETKAAQIYLQDVSQDHTRALAGLMHEKSKLLQTMQADAQYAFVDFQTVTYPDKKDIYTTIEVVLKNQPYRLQYVGQNTVLPHSQPDDLINKMQIYSSLALQMLITHQVPPGTKNCPVYHCVSEFQHPQLKPYLTLFNMGAIREKKLILDTLNDDPNPERRAAAAFLVGHFKDPQEIMTVLAPHVSDADAGVRNNVIRVIGATISKAHLQHIDAMPFLNLLDSPYGSDRNKSLYVLLMIADSLSGKQFIIQHGRERLLSVLKLIQPNNHDMAYLIMKKISGKNDSEYDLPAWSKWWASALRA